MLTSPSMDDTATVSIALKRSSYRHRPSISTVRSSSGGLLVDKSTSPFKSSLSLARSEAHTRHTYLRSLSGTLISVGNSASNGRLNSQWVSPVSRSFLHHLSQFINHGIAASGDLFLLPNTGCVIFQLHIIFQTIEKIKER
jgi:hypothetical protein